MSEYLTHIAITDDCMRLALQTDPFIQRARAVHFGTALDRKPWSRALTAAPSQSLYAQALERGTRYLEAASEFSARAISEAEFRELVS